MCDGGDDAGGGGGGGGGDDFFGGGGSTYGGGNPAAIGPIYSPAPGGDAAGGATSGPGPDYGPFPGSGGPGPDYGPFPGASGSVPGPDYGPFLTDLTGGQGGSGSPGSSGNAFGTSPGTNVLAGSSGGQSSAPGLPGVGATPDLTNQNAARPSGGGKDDSIMSSLGIKNPLGTAIGAAGLGYAMTQGQKPPAFTPEMTAAARNLDANGKQLMSYLQNGNLPPGLKAGLDQATAAAKAKITSNFAAQGLNTNPEQNSVLAQQLAQVEQQAIISTAQIGQQLMSSGLAQSGLSSDLYKTLAQIDQTQTSNIGKAIANFASASSGGGTTIRLGA